MTVRKAPAKVEKLDQSADYEQRDRLAETRFIAMAGRAGAVRTLDLSSAP